MTTRTALVDSLLISGSKLQADLAELIESVQVDYAVGQVTELTITAADPDGKLAASKLITLSSVLQYLGATYDLGSYDAQLVDWGVAWEFRARSSLARALRRAYKVSAEQKVSPSDWVRRSVLANAGKAVVQPSAKVQTISQRGGKERQSRLDVISQLASDLDWTWIEYAGTFIFSSLHYAWQGKLSRNTWAVTFKSDETTDALSMSVSRSDDDTETLGTIELELPYARGKNVRPFDRLQISGKPVANGVWVVTNVSVTHDDVTPVKINAVVPKKPAPKSGSTGG